MLRWWKPRCQCRCKTPHLCRSKIPQFVDGGRSLQLAELHSTEDAVRLVSTDGGSQGDYLGESIHASRTSCTRRFPSAPLPDKRDWTGRRSGVTWPRGSSHRCTDRERRKARYWAGILRICKPGLTSIRDYPVRGFCGRYKHRGTRADTRS